MLVEGGWGGEREWGWTMGGVGDGDERKGAVEDDTATTERPERDDRGVVGFGNRVRVVAGPSGLRRTSRQSPARSGAPTASQRMNLPLMRDSQLEGLLLNATGSRHLGRSRAARDPRTRAVGNLRGGRQARRAQLASGWTPVYSVRSAVFCANRHHLVPSSPPAAEHHQTAHRVADRWRFRLQRPSQATPVSVWPARGHVVEHTSGSLGRDWGPTRAPGSNFVATPVSSPVPSN